MKKRIISLLMICIIVVTNSAMYFQARGDSTFSYVIMFDESHGQYFNRTLMSTALDSFNELAAETGDDIKIELLFQTESEFNSTNLQGVDLLIFTNPGINEEYRLLPSEINVLLDYVELGGSLFLLCNPLTNNENITGHPTSINELLAGRDNRITSARIKATSNTSHADLIVDDFLGVYGNDSYLSLNLSEYNLNNPIFRQETLINTTTIFASPLILGDEGPTVAIGRTPITSYAVNDDYVVTRDLANGFLTWLLVKAYGEARVMLSGSTIMFSDLEITENIKWIEQSDNLDLWKNIILWLLKYTPHPERAPPTIWLFRNYALIIVGCSIIIFGSAFLLYQYRRKKRTSIKIN